MAVEDLIFIDATGVHQADFAAFQSYFIDGNKTIFGADIYLESDSQDGQFILLEASSCYDTASAINALYQSFAPVSAQGTGLSRLVKLNGLDRIDPTHSTVDLTIVGTAGTVITNGVAIDTLNQKWDLPSPTTIPGGGSITVTAIAEVQGAINAAASSVNQIFTPTRGWQTVNNAAPATPGIAVESDAELRLRQSRSTANPSLTVLEGTEGAVANLPGVQKVKAYENDTSVTDANGLPDHTICIVAKGGVTADIAQEIQIHKTPGTGTYGNTSTTVYDTHGMPLIIKFQRQTDATISVRLTLATFQGWTVDYEPLIAEAVAAYINLLSIGDTVQISKLYIPAYLVGTPAYETFDIVTLEIKKNAGSYVTTNISLNFDEAAVCDATTNVVFL